ncbi:thiaminase II [Metabacillus sp. GX 13764]|uniref:thiaminase II n=1 Tax=Metabacillus kandeliae TaxID=2900151 RepID=UPI001E580AB5|nr:thiaminase II [Metabacillus kandeliae]MCD7034384.1 thiaminase II [Metabacillus kandeliae]
MKASERLFEKAKPILEKTFQHPFVAGIGTGELPKESFIRYMKQDYVFLVDYSKLFAMAAAKSRNLESMAAFSRILNNTLIDEMELHRQYAAQFGISKEELEAVKPAPSNLAYTRYMLAAGNGPLEELIAAVLPCMWSYWEIGKMLKEKYPGSDSHPFYGEWVSSYASEEFGELACWLRDLLDELAHGKSERELAVLEEHYITASQLEYLFWEMAYKGEEWPV